MKRSPTERGTPSRRGIGWIVFGVAALLIGVVWCWLAVREVRLWAYADRYVDAELEVKRFYPKPRNSAALCKIEGMIHPGGEEVEASDEYIAIKHYDGPGDRQGREPKPSEIEGRRLPVSHWPRQAEGRRWWYPPAVVSRGQIPGAGAVWRDVVGGGAFLLVGWFSCRRGGRNLKSADPSVLKKD
jgi:hypothetical protein